MQGTVQSISEILQADSILLGMLALNAPIGRPDATKTKVASIMPIHKVKGKIATPFLTIQEGVEVFTGYTSKRQSVYIRCYNELSKSYIEINQILDRVRILLHKVELDLLDRTLVECKCEGRMPALEDEAFELRYKEEQYGITVL